MTDRKELLALTFYDREPFTGSDGNMNYRIEKIKGDEGAHFQVTIWPGPYSYPMTDPAVMEIHTEDFTEEGLEAITEWMNQQAPEYQKDIKSILDVDPYYPPAEEESAGE